MYGAFLGLKLKEEKQKKIINAAMKEFAAKGFRDASTNAIVQEAGISKGSLFHYFGSKKGLAEFLLQYSLDLFTEKIIKNMESMTDDLIERWRHMTLLKLALISEHPLIFEFMLRMAQETDEEIFCSMKKMQAVFTEDFKKKLYAGIDYSKFREDVDIGRALKLIFWGLEGYAREAQAQTRDCHITEELMETALEESNRYLDMFRRAFYKQSEG